MNQVRFLRGKQEDLDKLIESANALLTEKMKNASESDQENEIKKSNENLD